MKAKPGGSAVGSFGDRFIILAHRLMCSALCSLLLIPPPLMAQVVISANELETATKDREGFKEYLDASGLLDQAFLLMQEARSKLDRTRFVPSVILDNLDYDARKIIDFAKKEIKYEQYPGLLRGPAGTLMSRAGNSLDQSVLLSKLLRDAGYDARIVGGALTEAQVIELFTETSKHNIEKHHLNISPEVIDIFRQLNQLTNNSDETFSHFLKQMEKQLDNPQTKMPKRVQVIVQQIQNKFKEMDTNFLTPSPARELLAEAQSYYWVQFQDGAAEWENIHPALPQSTEFEQSVSPKEFHVDSVPKELQVRLRVRSLIEQKIGTDSEIHELMDPWERPVANLTGVPLTYRNHPDAFASPDDYLNLEASLARASIFFPIFNGSSAPGSRVFDRSGRAIDRDAAESEYAGVFKEVGRAFEHASESISGDRKLDLRRHWLEFTIIPPSGEAIQFERTIYQKNKNETFDKVRQASLLAQEHTFMVSNGFMPVDFALDEILRRQISTKILLESILYRTHFPNTFVEISDKHLKEVESDWWGHFVLFPISDQAADLANAHQTYKSAPHIVLHAQEPGVGVGQTSYIDFLSNERRAITIQNGVPHHDPIALVTAGVWDTISESEIMPAQGRQVTTTFSALSASSDEALQLILPEQSTEVARFEWPQQTIDSLQQDLGRGFAAIVPGLTDRPPQGWWRVNPRTGETLGQLSNGRGSAFTEAVTLLSGVLSFSFWLKGMAACTMKSNPNAFACCVGTNSAFWVGGIAIGGLAGIALIGTGAGAGAAAVGSFGADQAYNMATAKLEFCGG